MRKSILLVALLLGALAILVGCSTANESVGALEANEWYEPDTPTVPDAVQETADVEGTNVMEAVDESDTPTTEAVDNNTPKKDTKDAESINAAKDTETMKSVEDTDDAEDDGGANTVDVVEEVDTPAEQAVDDGAEGDASTGSKSEPTVTISVLGDEEKGTIIAPTEVEFEEGDTVIDVLKAVTRTHKIPLESRGISAFTYVEGIGNLYEFDLGASSGWIFHLNGELAHKSAGIVKVAEGDTIEWIFSIERDDD